MSVWILRIYPLLAIAAVADTSDCNVNLLQQRIELSSVQDISAKDNASMLMPDAVTVASIFGPKPKKAPSSEGNMNATLPTGEERMFDMMEETFNRSERALVSSEDLIDEFKKQTALEINWGQKAALAEANKLDALKHLDDNLKASMDLQSRVLHGIPSEARSLLPGKTARAENLTSKAAEYAAEAARLTEVVSWAKGNYTVAIEAAKKARTKRNMISARMQSLLDSALIDELNASRLVKAINNTFFLNLSGKSVIEVKIKGNASGVDLTDIVQADIDKYYSTTSGVTEQPRIVVEIVKASDGKVKKDVDLEQLYVWLPYIIGLALLLGVAIAGIAIMRGRA